MESSQKYLDLYNVKLIVNHNLLADSASCPLCDESARSNQMSFHELVFDELSNKPGAEEQVALTIASVERLILPTSIPENLKESGSQEDLEHKKIILLKSDR
ncbi:hypothetical protein H5410_045116 [Solanum commersonii]|uniref:Uncharacterized protein n=1 Tax=Solanum commersonii TaxID=4109 RepID=A0A9J5XA46_SOLCO|nr:hypothetical protein H5410_045116 [Solanum commersonii]